MLGRDGGEAAADRGEAAGDRAIAAQVRERERELHRTTIAGLAATLTQERSPLPGLIIYGPLAGVAD